MVEGHIRKTENECDQLVFDLLFEKEKKKEKKTHCLSQRFDEECWAGQQSAVQMLNS